MEQHTVRERYTRYYPERLTYTEAVDPAAMRDGFLLRLRLREGACRLGRRTVWEIPGMLSVEAGSLDPQTDRSTLTGTEAEEGYFLYPDGSGRCPFLTATLSVVCTDHPQWTALSVGLPLGLFPPDGRDFYLLYDGVRLGWIVDGELVNHNCTYGTPAAVTAAVRSDPDAVADTAILPCSDAVWQEEAFEETARSLAFYSPRGYNVWAGDATSFWRDGVYHLIVLQDRHHHHNRFDCGAHTAIHLTTRDFRHWENHGEMFPMRHPWQTVGTGLMTYHNGEYYYIFGYHTGRMVPSERLGSRLMLARHEQCGLAESVSYEELERQGCVPNGSNYAVSKDGIHFTDGRRQIHWAENPAVYAEEDGTLTMYAGYGADGVWQASAAEGPWRQVVSSFPSGHRPDGVRNSDECPAAFSWDGYRYVLMGFTGYWQTEKNGDRYIDRAIEGDDLYDGLCVPTVSDCDGRHILCGWLAGYGWAYLLAFRELVQKKDGRLGMRWMPEMLPDPADCTPITDITATAAGAVIGLLPRRSCLITMMVKPTAAGRVGLGFSGRGTPCVMELNTARRKVQIREAEDAGTFPTEQKAYYEMVPDLSERVEWLCDLPDGNVHFHSHDFAIAHVEELEAPYLLRVFVHYEPKTDSIVLDCEIGKGRTFISNRMDFTADRCVIFCENASVDGLTAISFS